MPQKKYAAIVVNRKTAAVDRIFHYLIPERLFGQAEIGSVVTVPFGREVLEGVIVDLPQSCEIAKLKEIIGLVSSKPLFDDSMIMLSRWLADYYLCTWVSALQAMLPAGLMLTGRLPQKAYKKVYRISEKANQTTRLTERQKMVLDYLLLHKTAEEKELVEFSASKDILRRMSENGLLEISEEETSIPHDDNEIVAIDFTEEQDKVYQGICREMAGSKRPFLLFGITASGKTEIYLRLIEKTVKQGGQCILLVPEIALTPQTVDFIKRRLNLEIAVLHSGMSMSERRLTWQRIAEGAYSVVVGARSAVFAPLKNLDLIIMDEEHDTSYKQDTNPRFHAREVAKERCRISGAQLVLGSATPSVESYYHAENQDYGLGIINERYYPAQIPKIEIIDMREELRAGNRSLLSRRLEAEIRARLEAGEQSLLLLNRRGYYTFYSCRECGEAVLCAHCAVPLVYHEEDKRLKCHYCGYSQNPPEHCPACGSSAIRHFGAGTERLVRELQRLLPDARIARLDQDTAAKRGTRDKVYLDMLKGETDILVGTQMIAKGLDFPNVTLAAVMAADLTLNLPDWRAGEKTYQLLTQLTGRAGRREKEGLAIIQTYEPLSPVIQAVSRGDYLSFYREEISYYRQRGYPPFVSLIRVVISGKSPESASEAAGVLAALFEKHLGENVTVCGPAQAPRSKVRDRYRYQILLKCNNPCKVKEAIKNIEEDVRSKKAFDKSIMIQIDVDPNNML